MHFVDRVAAVVLAGSLLLAGGGCRQTWKFAPAEYPVAERPMPRQVSLAEAPSDDARGSQPLRQRPTASEVRKDTYAGRGGAVPGASQSRRHDVSYQLTGYTASPVSGGETLPSSVFGPSGAAVCEPLPPTGCEPCFEASCGTAPRRSKLREFFGDVRSDYRNYYTWPTLRDLGIAVGVASPFANTSLDEDFQSWYQRDVRSSGTDNFSSFWKTFGEGQIFIPAFAGLAVVGGMLEDWPVFGTAGDLGARVTRGYLVGAPPMLFMQALLGGSRPNEVAVGSHWKPFDDNNGVSGHAFMGAVPFISAAMMCENPWARGTLYLCSTFTAWSRINDDDHYLSQVCLGWWMAYLACRSVDQTERPDQCYAITPIATPEMAGVGVTVYR